MFNFNSSKFLFIYNIPVVEIMWWNFASMVTALAELELNGVDNTVTLTNLFRDLSDLQQELVHLPSSHSLFGMKKVNQNQTLFRVNSFFLLVWMKLCFSSFCYNLILFS